jgi:hypothetical protein
LDVENASRAEVAETAAQKEVARGIRESAA